jgi:hypothetical protein
MRVVYTDQSYESLADMMTFLIQKQGWTLKKFLDFRKKLLD